MTGRCIADARPHRAALPRNHAMAIEPRLEDRPEATTRKETAA
jgi:hypothetical protein